MKGFALLGIGGFALAGAAMVLALAPSQAMAQGATWVHQTPDHTSGTQENDADGERDEPYGAGGPFGWANTSNWLDELWGAAQASAVDHDNDINSRSAASPDCQVEHHIEHKWQCADGTQGPLPADDFTPDLSARLEVHWNIGGNANNARWSDGEVTVEAHCTVQVGAAPGTYSADQHFTGTKTFAESNSWVPGGLSISLPPQVSLSWDDPASWDDVFGDEDTQVYHVNQPVSNNNTRTVKATATVTAEAYAEWDNYAVGGNAYTRGWIKDYSFE